MPLRRLRGNGGLGENVQVAMLAVDGTKPLCAGCQQKVGPCSTAMHWWFIWIGYLLTWAVIPHILTRNKPPASTLAWIWAVILFPYGGAIFYFLFGTDRLVRQKLRATREMDASGGRGGRRVTADTKVLLGGKFAWFRTAHPLRNQWTFTLRNHRELQIIDCQHCFVGGMNMGREYAGEDPAVGQWHNLQIEIRGGAVRKFQMIFADDWFFATQEKLLAPKYYPPPEMVQSLIVQPMTDGPDDPDDPIEMSLVWMFNTARQRVWLTGLLRSY